MNRLTTGGIRWNHNGALTAAVVAALTSYAFVASNGGPVPDLEHARGCEAHIDVKAGEYVALEIDADTATKLHQVGHAMLFGKPGMDIVISSTLGNFSPPRDPAFGKFGTHNDDGTRSMVSFIAAADDHNAAYAGLTPGKWYIQFRRSDNAPGPLAILFV